jgi:hypothetical protein
MKDEIESRLQALVRQPLIVSYRAADMEMFSFGQFIVRPKRRRHPSRVVTRFGLHVQCPWRIVCSGSLIVGYGDLREPRSDLPEAEAEDFDPNELETTLREELLEAFHRERAHRPRHVTALAASEVGDLRIILDDGCAIEVFPDSTAASREHWRFMDELGGHFVVGGEGTYYLP